MVSSKLLTHIPGRTTTARYLYHLALLLSPPSRSRALPAWYYYSSQSIVSLSSKDNESTPHQQKKKDWRKQQLETLEQKFQPSSSSSSPPPPLPGDWPVLPNMKKADTLIQDDADLQPMWKDMESRVKNRKSRTLAENKGRIGRSNIRKTDEDIWLEQGLYNNDDDSNSNNKDDSGVGGGDRDNDDRSQR